MSPKLKVEKDDLGMDWLTLEEVEKYGYVEKAILIMSEEDYAEMEKGNDVDQVVGILRTYDGKLLLSRDLGEPVEELF